MNNEYHIVSFSGGKDSTAMLLHMIEQGMHIDEVINFDTGVEFSDMYIHINKVKEIVTSHEIPFKTFKSELEFEHFLLEREREDKANLLRYGWGWPNMKNRWCTSYLKTRLIEPYLRTLKEKYEVIQYIGIASDEKKRMERDIHKRSGFRYPLVEWGWSESDCLQYCYDQGLDWNGLYESFSHVSCWLCPLQKISELYKLWDKYPELWTKLKEWDSKLIENCGTGTFLFKEPYTIDQLEKRFEVEKRKKSANINTKSRNFYKEIHLVCNGLPKNQTTLEIQ